MTKEKREDQQTKTWQWWIEKVIVPILVVLIPGYFLLISGGAIENPFKKQATSTATFIPSAPTRVDISTTSPLSEETVTPSIEKFLSPAIQVMDQYYKYINNANISDDLSRAWDLLTKNLQCNPSDQCNFVHFANFWWGFQVNYKLYDCGSNIVDTELVYFARGAQPLETAKPDYLRYTLAEEDGQLKLYSGENVNGISAYCLLTITSP